MPRSLLAVAALWALAVCSPAAAQYEEGPAVQGDRLVNLDRPAQPPSGVSSFAVDVRAFGGKEDLVYTTLDLSHGLREDTSLRLRGSLAARKSMVGSGFTIRHGGNDLELLLRYRLPNSSSALQVGLVLPDTPAQDELTAVAAYLYERAVSDRLSIVFAPSAVFVDENAIVGIGGGVAMKLSDRLALVVDVAAIVHGDNTRSSANGSKQRSEVWGVALRFLPSDPERGVVFDLGITNGTGGTTGSSLTSGLGGSAAFYARAAVRW